MTQISFVVGCLTEFLGIYLITANRGDKKYTPDDKHHHEETVVVRVSSDASDSSRMDDNASMPLLHDAEEDMIHPPLSRKRSSLFCGISLHSQLAGGRMNDENVKEEDDINT